MARIRRHNSFVTKILIILGIICFVCLVLWFTSHVLMKNYHNLIYDLGERGSFYGYNDKYITNYDDYKKLMKDYNLRTTLKPNSFIDNYYIASFQEYDSCSEKDYKTVDHIDYGEKVKITFKVHNRCGWCKQHIALYLIKVDISALDKEIEYDYVFDKDIECDAS